LRFDDENAAVPLLNVFGGKLTTYRRLGEHALELIEEKLGKKRDPWTAGSSLPGGDFPATGYEDEVAKLKRQFAFLSERHARRYIRLYGTKAYEILGDAAGYDAFGRHFGGDLHQREVDYLIAQEWAVTAEDVLWRRTKQGLYLTAEQANELADYMRGSVTQ
jgi:glycerol-3-phosphate dehydrogenase